LFWVAVEVRLLAAAAAEEAAAAAAEELEAGGGGAAAAGGGAAAAAEEEEDDDDVLLAPVAARRAVMSAWVSQVMVVPGALVRGRAAQVVPAPQGWITNDPPTHWAKPPLMQAWSPALQGDEAVRAANLVFKAIAAWPLARSKEERRKGYAEAARARAKVTKEYCIVSERRLFLTLQKESGYSQERHQVL